MKTAVVTGATGCIGHAVVNALLADERSTWNIHILTRPTSDLRKIADFLPLVTVGWPPAGTHIAAIFHCGGNTSHHLADTLEVYHDNLHFTETMAIESMVRNVGCFIFTSTAAAHMYPKPFEVIHTKNHYARSKSMAELMVEELDSYVIIQPCVVIGERDTRNYSPLFDLAKDGKIAGAMPGGIEFGYVHDIAKAHVDAYWNGKRCEKYILGGVKATWQQFFEVIHRVVGNPKSLRVIPTWQLRLYCAWLYVKHWFGGERPILTEALVDLLAVDANVPVKDAQKSFNDLGYAPTLTLEQMVDKAYRWHKKSTA